MQRESLEIKNYRLFLDANLEGLPRIAVVAEANARASPTLYDDTHLLGRGGRGVRSLLDGWQGCICCLPNPKTTNRTERVLLLSWRSLVDFARDVLGVMQTPRGRGL